MKKTIKTLISITIMCLAPIITMSSCQKTEKRVYFDFPASGGMIEIPIGAESDDLSGLFDSSTVINEDSAPREIVIESIFPDLHASNPFCYIESTYSDSSGLLRAYEYRTETGSGQFYFYTKHNKLVAFLESTKSAVLKEKYMNLSESDLLSKEECLKKAEAFLAVLYDNSESFTQYDNGEYKMKLEGLEVDCTTFKFIFRWDVDGVEICNVRINVRNDGEIVSVANYYVVEAYCYDKTKDLDFSAALKEADDAVNEKVKSFGDKYTAQFDWANLMIGSKNRLILMVQYELYKDDLPVNSMYVYVVL